MLQSFGRQECGHRGRDYGGRAHAPADLAEPCTNVDFLESSVAASSIAPLLPTIIHPTEERPSRTPHHPPGRSRLTGGRVVALAPDPANGGECATRPRREAAPPPRSGAYGDASSL